MRVCHIVPSLEERHGGPSKSVRALANAQSRLAADVTLLATVGPGCPAPDVSGDSARILVTPRQAPLRLCRSAALQRQLFTVDYECVHSHALWLLPLHYAHQAAHRRGVPLVISPRGMLSSWAHGHHRWRKKLSELLVHPGAFAAAAGWHATSPEEADDIRRLGHTQPVCVAPNGVELPGPMELTSAREAWLAAHPALRGRRVALFYSRFHRKKRVRELLALWGARPRGDWALLVAGIPEEFSVAELRAGVAALPAGGSIVVADSTGLPPPFPLAELFLLPSHSENFGLVIAESLAAGVPALVTDTTPWRALDREQAGRCVPWEEYSAALEIMLRLPPLDLAGWGERARRWAARDFTWERAAGLLLEFYRHLRHA
ncbi:MAG: glycosyltransferase [Opitutales bacterium]